MMEVFFKSIYQVLAVYYFHKKLHYRSLTVSLNTSLDNFNFLLYFQDKVTVKYVRSSGAGGQNVNKGKLIITVIYQT